MFIVWPTTFEKYFKFYAKLFCCFKKGGDCLKSKFLENWVQILCFGRAFHLILMHFYILYSMLWGKFSKNQVFFSKMFFFEFRLIQSNFRLIEILFKNLGEPLPGSIGRTYFSIDRRLWIQFFKNSVLTDSTYFFKSFSTFSLSLQLGKVAQRFFVVFYLNFCKVFLPQGR